jgi:hemoglobin
MHSLSLVDRLGGRAGVTAAVLALYERLLDDEDVAPYFDDIDLPALRTHMVDFLIAALTGSADGYGGRLLDLAHRGLGVTNDAFDRVVHHLSEVLDLLGVDPSGTAEVAKHLAPLRVHIVAQCES